MSWKCRPVAGSVVLHRRIYPLLPSLELAQMCKEKRVRRDTLREENEVLSVIRLVAGRFVIHMCTRRSAAATGPA